MLSAFSWCDFKCSVATRCLSRPSAVRNNPATQTALTKLDGALAAAAPVDADRVTLGLRWYSYSFSEQHIDGMATDSMANHAASTANTTNIAHSCSCWPTPTP
jgi:hypothetical protein